MIPVWITFLISNIICAVGTILNIIDVARNRDKLKGYPLTGSSLTLFATIGFLLGFAQDNQWLSVIFGSVAVIYWLFVTLFLIKQRKKRSIKQILTDTYQIAKDHAISLSLIVTGICFTLGTWFQADTFVFDIRDYWWLYHKIWVPELGLSCLDVWKIMFILGQVGWILILIGAISWRK